MPVVKVGNINMYYEIHGKGEPLVLIHGAGLETSTVGPLIQMFTSKYKVVSIDNRGVGRTDKPDEPYSIEMMAEDTVDLLNIIGIKKAHFIGSSMGGRIAQVIAVKHPEMVKGLILTATAARVSSSMKTELEIALKTPELWEEMFKESAVLFTQMYPPTRDSFYRQFVATVEFDGKDQLNQIKAPTLIINGTKDYTIPRECTEELAREIPNSKLILVEGDHLFAAVNIDLLVKPAIEFFEEFDARSALKA